MEAIGAHETRKKPQFGNRYLTDARNVFEHNAWDDVQWNDELEMEAEAKIKNNSEKLVPENEQEEYENKANIFWDKFYGIHKNRFFKDRNWLLTEFPELYVKHGEHKIVDSIKTGDYADLKTNHSNLACISNQDDNCTTTESNETLLPHAFNILEIGCGVGNTVFPIIEANLEENVIVYCCDFSEVAVSLVKSHPSFDPEKCIPFVCDVSSDSWDTPFSFGSMDVIILIFVLSAIHPDRMQFVINRIAKYLKPGGNILFRDYGKYDMVELRFKPGHCLSDDFYVRGDGTRVYFFTEEKVHELFNSAGLIKKQNIVSRRLQVNRGKLLTMYRIWIQAKYMKPLHE